MFSSLSCSVSYAITLMYKQLNITWFVVTSIVLHAAFLTQYQGENKFIFKNSDESIDVIISRKIIKLRLLGSDLPPKNIVIKSDNTQSNKENVRSAPNRVKKVVSKNLSDDTAPHSNFKKPDVSEIVQQQKTVMNNDSKKNLYIENILLEIEKNKFYPTIARKRNMQENVKVSFTLLENGDVTDLEINGRFKILRHAAKKAMLNALPFNTPPVEMQLPFTVKYSMAFNLK